MRETPTLATSKMTDPRLRAGPAARSSGELRALAWTYLAPWGRSRLGDEGWEQALRDVGAPSLKDPFTSAPIGGFTQLLDLLDRRAGSGDGAVLREAGLAFAAEWARSYRALARRLAGDPRTMLAIWSREVLPWLLEEPDASEVLDSSEASAILRMPPEFPAAFAAGLLEGVVLAVGVPSRVAATQGARFVVAWEAAAAANAKPRRVTALARAMRLPFLGASLLPVLLGAGLAARQGFLDAPLLLLTALGAGCLHLGSNALNDYFDHRSRVDEENLTPTPFAGGSRVIQRGELSARSVLALAAGLYALACLAGVAIAFGIAARSAPGLIAILALGLAGLLLGWLYSAPPARLSHRGLGELAVGLGFGPLVILGTVLVQSSAAGRVSGALEEQALGFGLALGALMTAVLVVNELPDLPWDARAGKRTLAVRLGAERTATLCAGLFALGYGSLAWGAFAWHAWPALLGLATIPLAARALRVLRISAAQPFRLARAGAATLAAHSITALLVALGLWWQGGL